MSGGEFPRNRNLDLKFPSSSNQYPSHWLKNIFEPTRDTYDRIEINALSLKYIGFGENDADAASIRTNTPVPRSCDFYYFEITIINEGLKGLVGVGFSQAGVNLARMPGWDAHSYGYHGDDGMTFSGTGIGTQYGPTYIRIGHTIGYTKNGVDLGIAFRDVPEDALYPTVGLLSINGQVMANLGNAPFQANVEALRAEVMKQPLPVESDAKSTNLMVDENNTELETLKIQMAKQMEQFTNI